MAIKRVLGKFDSGRDFLQEQAFDPLREKFPKNKTESGSFLLNLVSHRILKDAELSI